jgi:ATP-dependent protease ClpP protease subunit
VTDATKYAPLHREVEGVDVFRIYFCGPIQSSPGAYAAELDVLLSASASSVVEIYFNSQGGHLSTGIMLADHISECRAQTVGIIGFECASAASMMALRCDTFRISALSTMMAHSIEYSVDGDAPRQREYAGFMGSLSEQYVQQTYQKLLTHEELMSIIHHSKTVDLTSHALSVRLPRIGSVTLI